MTLLRKYIAPFIKSERASAAVEYSLLALPLFVPVLIFLNTFSDISEKEQMARSIARESVRAYASSPNDAYASINAQATAFIMAHKLGMSDSDVVRLRFTVDCTMSPCISPNSKIRVTIALPTNNRGRFVEGHADERINAWN